jgi:hypothetical protein
MGELHEWLYVAPCTERMRVPGGWLYRVTDRESHSSEPPTCWVQNAVALCFVPDMAIDGCPSG